MSPSDSCRTRLPMEPLPGCLTARQASRVANHRLHTCRAHYPGEQVDLHLSVPSVDLGGLRLLRGDSALAFNLSGPAQASLALRPAHLLARPKRALSPELRRLGHPHHRPGSYQGVPTPPWAGLAPAALTDLSRRTLKYVVGQRQFCWAHVTRNVLSALDLATTPSGKRFCQEALVLERRLFRLWHRFRDDPSARGSPLTRAELITKVRPIERRLFALGERHLNAANPDVRNLARTFFVHNQHFFTFVYEESVEPTNNSAERALRTAVQWRKIMFGTRSAQGERAVERLLTIARTCQLQQLNALAYLTAAVVAHRRGQPVASLLKRRQTP